MWLSLVMPVPRTVSVTKRATWIFRAPALYRADFFPKTDIFWYKKCQSEKAIPLKNKQQTHSCDKNHRNEPACCPSRAVVCLRLQTPVRPRKYDKIITNTVLYPLRHPTCFGTSLYKKPYYLHRQQGQTTKQTEKETHTEAAPDTLLPNLQIRMYSLRKT